MVRTSNESNRWDRRDSVFPRKLWPEVTGLFRMSFHGHHFFFFLNEVDWR